MSCGRTGGGVDGAGRAVPAELGLSGWRVEARKRCRQGRGGRTEGGRGQEGVEGRLLYDRADGQPLSQDDGTCAERRVVVWQAAGRRGGRGGAGRAGGRSGGGAGERRKACGTEGHQEAVGGRWWVGRRLLLVRTGASCSGRWPMPELAGWWVSHEDSWTPLNLCRAS